MRFKGDAVSALGNLARILATHPAPARRDVQEAIRLAEKACELTHHRRAVPLDVLSVAYAAAGRFADAQAAAERALKRALATGKQEMVRELRRRIALYEKRSPGLPASPSSERKKTP